ncbi:hypothetical protein GCM10023210_29390 [Chryseobacterium ginsengisoli]|uniref:Uncharacterized protein n=1 Tax=Chryseobacterium ginsengisoli TaxID=363853 RepID=A0ABP9MIX9_9FLAO
MKTIIKILIILTIFPFSKVNAQVSDTLAYVKNFETNKANYIGQPFSKLLNEMNLLQPKSLCTNQPRYSLIKFSNAADEFNIGTVNMIITWETPLPATETEYYENKNHFYFTNDERSYYGNKIIKNISIYVTN